MQTGKWLHSHRPVPSCHSLSPAIPVSFQPLGPLPSDVCGALLTSPTLIPQMPSRRSVLSVPIARGRQPPAGGLPLPAQAQSQNSTVAKEYPPLELIIPASHRGVHQCTQANAAGSRDFLLGRFIGIDFSKSGFLHLDSTDIQARSFSVVWACPMHCRTSSRTPGY